VSWLTRRLDHLGSAAFGGCGGIVLSQAPAFSQAYLQRLGGHIDEARRTIERVADGSVLPWLSAAGREAAVAELGARLEQLQALRATLLDSPALLRPVMLLGHGEWSIMQRTAAEFTPGIPLDPASLVWTTIGIVAAALAWDTLKIPAWWRRRRRTSAAPGDRGA